MLLLLGLLLMAATAAFVGLLIAYNLPGGPDYTVAILGSHPFTISTLGAFCGGIALALIFGFGMWLMFGGTMLARRRHRRRSADRRAARRAMAERDAMASRMRGGEATGTTADTAPPPTDQARGGATSGTFRSPRHLHLPGHS